MALQRQNIEIVFDALNTKIDPRTAVKGSMDTVENAFQTRPNEWRKRFGSLYFTTDIVGGGSLTTGRRVSSFNDEVIQAADTDVYTWVDGLQAWESKGRSSYLGVSATPLLTNIFSQSVVDIAIGGGYMLAVYEVDAGAVHYMVAELATGAIVLRDASLGAFSRPRVVALATKFAIVYTDGTNLKAQTVAYATPRSISGVTNLVADVAAGSPHFDIMKVANIDFFEVAYHSNVAGNELKTFLCSNVLATSQNHAFNKIPDQCIGWAAWDASDGNMYLMYVSSVSGWECTYVVLGAGVGAVTTLDAGIAAARNVTGYYNGSTATLSFAEVGAGTAYNTLIRLATSAVPGVSSVVQRSVGLASRVFVQGSRHFVLCTYESSLQPSYFLLDVDAVPCIVVGKAFYGQGGGLTKRTSVLPNAVAINASNIAIPVLRLTQAFSAVSAIYTGLTSWYLTFDFGGSGLSPYRRLGGNLHMSGSVPRIYDGNASSEAGFHLIPEQPTLAPSVGAGGLTPTGVYQYIIVCTFFDGQGQIAESGPSIAKTVTLGGADNTVTLTIPTIRLTDKPQFTGGGTGVFLIDIYRTTNGGTTFYKITDQNLYVLNLTTADTITYVDLFADGGITGKKKLYTTGGVLENVPWPPARLVEALPTRLFLAGTENENELWVSKEFQPGLAVNFNDTQIITLDSEGGGITALAEMDGALIIFKRSAVYVLQGDGPNDLGQGQFPQPQRISTKVGAEVPYIAKTSEGLIFKSPKGFYLLSRARDITYVGAAVEAYNSYTVTGAVVTDSLNQARFTTSNGTTLTYDSQIRDMNNVGKWAAFTNQAFISCDLWQQTAVYLTNTGFVAQDLAGYDDAQIIISGQPLPGSPITTKLATNFIELGGIAGHRKLYEIHILGEYRGTHILKVTLYYNGSSTSTETFTKDAGALTYTGPYQPYRFRCKPKFMDCESVRIQIEDDLQGAVSEGFRLSGIMLVCGVLEGGARLDTTRRMTSS